MELNDILTLVKAGYTRNEIEQMERPGAPDPVPAPEPAPEPVQTPEPIPAPVDVPVAPAVPAPQPTQQEAQPTMAELMQSIAKLTSAVQANAIAQSVIPGGANPQTPTAEDMLAEIIRPTFKERT
jgi:hypothetical protein